MTRLVTVLAIVCVLVCEPHVLLAQSADELAKQTQNPVSSLISVPFRVIMPVQSQLRRKRRSFHRHRSDGELPGVQQGAEKLSNAPSH